MQRLKNIRNMCEIFVNASWKFLEVTSKQTIETITPCGYYIEAIPINDA